MQNVQSGERFCAEVEGNVYYLRKSRETRIRNSRSCEKENMGKETQRVRVGGVWFGRREVLENSNRLISDAF